jgi:hypothetical protein
MSANLMLDIPIMDRTHGHEGNLQVLTEGNPRALFFKDAVRGALYAAICGDCGFAEIYLDNPEKFYQAYLAGQQNREG